MKRFETFGEYMFSLMFGPLKRGKQSANQFRTFFRVIGRIFDGMKEDAFRIREEASIATASHITLPLHGLDRDMPRLEGEDMEAYRARLFMKGLIAEWGGTTKGIIYSVASLGYPDAVVEPFYLHDPDRWAEFIIHLGKGNGREMRDLRIIYSEVLKVKEGSSKLAYFLLTDYEPFVDELFLGCLTSSYVETTLNNPDELILIRDREFHRLLRLGPLYASYREDALNDADDLVLVRDRDFEPPLLLAPVFASYSETVPGDDEDLNLCPDRQFEATLHAGATPTTYKEEQYL